MDASRAGVLVMENGLTLLLLQEILEIRQIGRIIEVDHRNGRIGNGEDGIRQGAVTRNLGVV